MTVSCSYQVPLHAMHSNREHARDAQRLGAFGKRQCEGAFSEIMKAWPENVLKRSRTRPALQDHLPVAEEELPGA